MPERAETPLQDPMAPLERSLIEEYLQQRGQTLSTIYQLSLEERHTLLVQAAQYADVRLAAIDARAAYLQE